MEEYLESWFLESGIQLKESWIPLTIGIRNPELKTFLHSLKAWFLYATDESAT